VSAPFVRFLDVMLPDGGYVVVEVEAYFDESGSHRGSPLLCVAGYIIEKERAIRLSADWRDVLQEHKLPFFRMSDCAHGNGPFAGMTKQHRVEVEGRMIGLIKRYTAKGLAVTMSSDEFSRLAPKHHSLGGPYSFCAHVILAGVCIFMENLERDHGVRVDKMAYFFEAGHESRPEADRIIKTLFSEQRIRNDYRYSGHAFVLKEQTPAVQAADLLAWQWFTDKRHQVEGRPRRRDCISLLEHPHDVTHVGPAQMQQMTDGLVSVLKRHGISEGRAMELLHYGVEK
jgi:hypothetical protein